VLKTLRVALLPLGLLAIVAFGGCGETSEADKDIAGYLIVLDEWDISGRGGASLPGVRAGTFEITVRNTGTTLHELVILKTNLEIDSLPVDNQVVQEKKAGEVIGEVEEFQAGDTERATFSLAAGRYALICNVPGHYQRGMYAELEVAP